MVTDFKKNKRRKIVITLLLHIGGLVVVFFFIMLVVANIKVSKKRQELLAQISNLESQVNNIKEQNSHLKEGILKSSDEQYVEKIAREELNLLKPGEKEVSFIMPQTTNPENAQGTQNAARGWFSWFSASLQWIKSKF